MADDRQDFIDSGNPFQPNKKEYAKMARDVMVSITLMQKEVEILNGRIERQLLAYDRFRDKSKG